MKGRDLLERLKAAGLVMGATLCVSPRVLLPAKHPNRIRERTTSVFATPASVDQESKTLLGKPAVLRRVQWVNWLGNWNNDATFPTTC